MGNHTGAIGKRRKPDVRKQEACFHDNQIVTFFQ